MGVVWRVLAVSLHNAHCLNVESTHTWRRDRERGCALQYGGVVLELDCHNVERTHTHTHTYTHTKRNDRGCALQYGGVVLELDCHNVERTHTQTHTHTYTHTNTHTHTHKRGTTGIARCNTEKGLRETISLYRRDLHPPHLSGLFAHFPHSCTLYALIAD